MVSLRYACMMLIVAGAVNSKFGKLLLLNFSMLERVFCITDYFNGHRNEIKTEF